MGPDMLCYLHMEVCPAYSFKPLLSKQTDVTDEKPGTLFLWGFFLYAS